jgi:predicted MFS family arabinose efflux permease
VDAISPVRLGRSFRWLLASSWAANLGDGIALAAGPLLVASETHDPVLVAAAALLQRLPWLLFGLHAGVLADRVDRRLIVVTVDLLRAAILLVLSVMVVTGAVNVWVVLAAMFLIGTAETFVDTTTNTLLPMLVHSSDLGIGNARLMMGQITANQLVGPPIGAGLFAVGRALPFASQAVLVAAGALLVSRIVAPPPSAGARSGRARTQIVEGISWLWHHAAMRTLTIAIVAFNVTFGAAWSVLVLYSSERLGMGDVGFGLIATVGALGGIVGSSAYGWLERRVSLADIMRVGLVVETLTHLSLALTTRPAIAMAVFFVFGAHAAIWSTTSNAIRHRAVPTDFQGRVGSVYMMGVQGGLVIGAALGGIIAQIWGVTGPFWFAFAGSAVILVSIWRELDNIAHAG